MKNFRISISNHSVRRAREAFRRWRENRAHNKARRNSMRHKRYWRATSKSGTVDLGHLNESEALNVVSRMGPIVFNDWLNAVIIYDDGTLKSGD